MSEGAQFTRVHGGIIDDQMLKGNLRFFSMTGPFSNTLSNGTIYILGDMPKFGGTADKVPVGKAVPRSAAELAFQVITSRCSVAQIIIVDDGEIQFVTENSSFAWEDPLEILTDVQYMEANVKLLGNRVVPGDIDGDGVVVDLSTVAITEFTAFKLA